MQVNDATLDLIKQWEGCKLEAYKDIVGVWTVGYGLTSKAGIIEVKQGTTITQAEADHYLAEVVDKFAAKILPAITAPITPNQFGAFVSLAYNIGPGAFKKSSALRHFNAGNLDKVPGAMRLWNKAGGKKVQGLVNRRESEVALFLKPEAPAAAPAPAAPPVSAPAAPTLNKKPSLVQIIFNLLKGKS